MIRSLIIAAVAAFAVNSALSAEPAAAPKKPAPAAKKPAAKPSAKPTPKPAPSKKDIALAAARKCDENKNNSISGGEVSALRLAFRDPQNFLDIYDDNGNGSLDDQEINRLNADLKPPTPAASPKGSKTSKSTKKKK